jgi:hypothetical protein
MFTQTVVCSQHRHAIINTDEGFTIQSTDTAFVAWMDHAFSFLILICFVSIDGDCTTST